jgi:hypothetical protein
MNAPAQEVGYVTEDGQILTEEQVRAQKQGRLQSLYLTFAAMRDRWVMHRAALGVEERWRKSQKLFHGDPDMDARVDLATTLRDGPSKPGANEAPRSRVVVNIVRPKVEQAVARLCEILFPVDDRNWGIRPTPMPELASRLGNQAPTVDAQGNATGLTADQEAQALIKAAKEAGEKMEKSIDDNLTECAYNGESRRIIEDGVRLGTGIMKGPFPRIRKRKVWNYKGNVASLTMDQKVSPSSARVDPFDIYFDPGCGNNHQAGRGAFERKPVTRKELRALVGIPGYDPDAIRQVLRMPPNRVKCVDRRVTREVMPIQDDAYELWEYHGEIEPEDVCELGERLNYKESDPLKDVTHAVVVMVNDVIIGCLESWIEDGSLPYDIWNWRQADDSPYGYGLSEELEHQQRVVNGAWRQVMDNGRVSNGGQIVMRNGSIIPQNGRYEITPNKVWLTKDDVEDINKAFVTYQFDSHLQELLAVANAAMQFSDTESNMPQLMGGEKGSAPETLGGMVMLYNNANAVLRQRVKLYDDNITRPHLGRYYDFKMAHDPDGTIKGDYEVDARGSSTLVERDIQNQAMLNLANITNNPRYAPHLKERDEIKTILKAFKINPDDLMKTEEQVTQEQQNSQPPQDPKIVAAQMTLQAKQLDLKDREAQRQFQAQRNATDDEFRNRQLAYNQQREQAEFTIAQTDSSIKRDTALLRENNALTISREGNAARERLGMINIETKRQIFNAEAHLRVQTGSGI